MKELGGTQGSSIILCFREPEMVQDGKSIGSWGADSFPGQRRTTTQVRCLPEPPQSFTSATGTLAHCLSLLHNPFSLPLSIFKPHPSRSQSGPPYLHLGSFS